MAQQPMSDETAAVRAELEKALLDVQRLTADRDRLQGILNQLSNAWRLFVRTLG